MSKDKREKDPVITILNIIIILLIFVILYFGQSAFFYRSMAEKRSFTQDAGHMSYELQNGDYAGLIQGRYVNEFNGNNDPAGYHALAEYIEAASMYRVYRDKGYMERADREKAVMDSSRTKMQELSIFADKADKMFGIADQ
ncbi:MAG: hypothetical protein K5888_10530 [Lachnospiraceae bacterium]|nr:hypothetical protein [Lachnospiraceae bacterium]